MRDIQMLCPMLTRLKDCASASVERRSHRIMNGLWNTPNPVSFIHFLQLFQAFKFFGP